MKPILLLGSRSLQILQSNNSPHVKNGLGNLKRGINILRSYRGMLNPETKNKSAKSTISMGQTVVEPMVLAEPVLAGRERELKELHCYLKLAMNGKGTTVFISGEAGSGKTRLISEFRKSIEEKNVTVLTGWCLNGAAIPYFPFIEAFNSYLPNQDNEEASVVNQRTNLKSWLVETNRIETYENLAAMQYQVWQDHAFHQVSQELLSLSTKNPIVLVLDDIHWADSASLSLLHYLARQIGSERIIILATFRSEELSTINHHSSLSKTLLLMERDDLYKEVKLSALNPADIEMIAQNMLGGTIHPELVKELATESHGNPLFIVESLRMLYQEGHLSEKAGQWKLSVEKIEIPKKVKDVILVRLESLESQEREVLDIASVLGEKFDPKLIAPILCQDTTTVLRVLNNIAKRTLFVNCDTMSCRFEHPNYREMLYREIPLLLKKEYHLKIAEKIEAATPYNSEDKISDLAYHFAQAESKSKAIKYSLKAGEIALSKFSNLEAIRHFSYVTNNANKDSGLVNEELMALEGLGDAFYASGMFKESMKAFETIVNNVAEEGVKLRALRKATESAFQCGNASYLLELVGKAESYAGSNRLENARVLFTKARALIMQNRVTEALNDSRTSLQIFEEECSLWDVAFASIEVGLISAFMGDLQSGLASILRSIALFEELGDFRWQMEAYYAAGQAFVACFLEYESLEMNKNAIEIEEKMKMADYYRLVWANTSSAWALEDSGNSRKALVYSQKALEYCRKTDSLLAMGVVFSCLTRQYALLGDVKHSKEYYQKFLELPLEIRTHPLTHGYRTEAVYYAGQKQWDKSNRCFERLFDYVKSTGKEHTYDDLASKLNYVWALDQQGQSEKASVQHEKNKKDLQKVREKFEHSNVQISLMRPTRVQVGQTFEARLDLVNVSKASCFLLRVDNLLDPNLQVLKLSQSYVMLNESIELEKEELKPFKIKTIKIFLKAKHAGSVTFTPQVTYVDNNKKTITCEIKAVCIDVAPVSISSDKQVTTNPAKIEFASESTEKAFNYLLKAFEIDYLKQKLPMEKSGWRSLMDVVRNGNVSKHSMYGRTGRGGKAKSELGYLGLVESRFFLGEMGRGGRVLKLRILLENKYVKEILDMRSGEH